MLWIELGDPDARGVVILQVPIVPEFFYVHSSEAHGSCWKKVIAFEQSNRVPEGGVMRVVKVR